MLPSGFRFDSLVDIEEDVADHYRQSHGVLLSHAVAPLGCIFRSSVIIGREHGGVQKLESCQEEKGVKQRRR